MRGPSWWDAGPPHGEVRRERSRGGEGWPLGEEWREVSTPGRTLGNVYAWPVSRRQMLVHLFTMLRRNL